MAEPIYPEKRKRRNAKRRGSEGKCDQCGAVIYVKPSCVHRPRHFCNKACHSGWMSQNTRGSHTSNWKGGEIAVKCERCEISFSAPRAEVGRGRSRFCSPQCFVEARKSKRREVICHHCHTAFLVAANRLKSAKFCSRSCKHAGTTKVRSPDEIVKRRLDLRFSALIWYSLRHGKGKGGRSWKELVPYTVEELRAHLHKTLPCGYAWDDFVSGALEVDHIIPRSAFNYSSPDDYDFQRCWALSNLQLLPAFDNNSKGSKLSGPFQPSLL